MIMINIAQSVNSDKQTTLRVSREKTGQDRGQIPNASDPRAICYLAIASLITFKSQLLVSIIRVQSICIHRVYGF